MKFIEKCSGKEITVISKNPVTNKMETMGWSPYELIVYENMIRISNPEHIIWLPLSCVMKIDAYVSATDE